MPAALRSKKSTVANAVQTAQLISTKIEPTLTLTEVERTHFDRIAISREVDTWSSHDVTIACQLAKALTTLELAQDQLRVDGLTIENARGSQVAHPLLHASMSMASTVQQLTKTLGLSASQRGLSGPKQQSRNLAEQTARKVIGKAAADDLLA
jgi:phage terminase small subunit